MMKQCPRVREGTLKAPTKRCWCRVNGYCSGPPLVREIQRQHKGLMTTAIECVIDG
jgi:hypothetical protein